MRDGDNNTEVLVQYFKLVTLHDRPPLYDTPHPPPIAPMTSRDVTWRHWCDVARPPLRSWTLILWLHFFFFYLSLVMSWENFPHSYTSPHIHSWIFEALQVIIFWVRVIHKMLNVNWEKIDSIILCVTCHGLRNFPWLIHIPSKSVMNCWNPMSYYFLS